MKNFGVVLALVASVLGLCEVAVADDGRATNTTPAFTATILASWRSQYVLVNGFAPHEGTIFIQELTLSHRSGFYADLWNAVSPTGGWSSDGGDEVDYAIGFARTVGKFAVDAGYTYFDLRDPSLQGANIRDASLRVVFGRGQLRPYVLLDWLFGTKPQILEGGFGYRVGVQGTAKKLLFGRDLNANVFVAGHDGEVGRSVERLSYGRLILSTSIRVPGGLEVVPTVFAQVSFNNTSGIARDHVWAEIALARSFSW